MKASLHIETLKAAALAASNEETRSFLKGVLCEVEENHVTYVATDGHILFCRRVSVMEPNTLQGKFIIPLAAIKTLKASKKAPNQIAIYERVPVGKPVIYLLDGERAEPIDGTFPHWRAIVPSAPYAHAMKDAHGSYQLDGSKLAVFNKIGDVLGFSGPPVQVYNAGGPTLIYFAEDIGNSLGLVMPMRVAHDPKVNFRPEWI